MSSIPVDMEHGGERASRGAVRYLAPIARVLMGLVFLAFGLNGFLHFLPNPGPDSMPAGAVAFASALAATGYMMALVSGTQVVVGALLLVNRFVPLALVLIAPVIVNIILFHVFLAPSGIGPGAVVLILEIYLVWAYRNAYRSMFAPRVTPV
jgi:uncharacterized membrane protein YphA (DoxX/SURF4 family)